MKTTDALVEQYMEEYRARGLAPETVAHVTRELTRLATWLKQRRPRIRLDAVNTDVLIRYIRHRTVFRAKATVGTTVWVLRSFGEFLVREGVWAQNPLRWIRGPKLRADARVPRRINAAAMQRLLSGAAVGRQSYHRRLWLAIIALLYGTGIRRGELIRANVADWQPEAGLLRVDGRKTGRQRHVPVPPLAAQCLEAYLVQRHNHLERLGGVDEPALFINQVGHRLREHALSCGVQRLARRCGLGRVTLHQFRHSCASDLLEGGVQLPAVQQLLGHQTITTTVRYLHIADPHRRAAVRLHPINDMLAAGGAA